MAETPAPIAALAGVIRHVEGRERVEADADAFLRELGLDDADRERMLAAGASRLLAYRSLVHNRMRNVCFNFLPRTRAHLGDAAVRTAVATFVAEEGVRSPFLRDVPGEFVRWVAPRWEADPSIPPFIPELARFELLSEDVPNDPRAVGEATEIPVALDAGIVVNGTLQVLEFEWAVQRRPSDPENPEPLQRDATIVVVCRDREHGYRQLIVEPLGRELIARLRDGATLQEAIFSAAEAVGEPVADPLLERATVILAQLSDADALLGAVVGD